MMKTIRSLALAAAMAAACALGVAVAEGPSPMVQACAPAEGMHVAAAGAMMPTDAGDRLGLLRLARESAKQVQRFDVSRHQCWRMCRWTSRRSMVKVTRFDTSRHQTWRMR